MFDRKPYVRTFLAETFEDLGFIAECWAEPDEILPALNSVEPDLVVIVVPDDHGDVEDVLKLLAAARFRGRIMLDRAAGACRRSHAHRRLGEQLGLAMLPPLGTPFARVN